MLRLAHAYDRGVHVLVVEDEAKRHLRKLHSGWYEALQAPHALDRLREVFGSEVARPPVVGWESRVKCESASEATLIERDARYHTDVRARA